MGRRRVGAVGEEGPHEQWRVEHQSCCVDEDCRRPALEDDEWPVECQRSWRAKAAAGGKASEKLLRAGGRGALTESSGSRLSTWREVWPGWTWLVRWPDRSRALWASVAGWGGGLSGTAGLLPVPERPPLSCQRPGSPGRGGVDGLSRILRWFMLMAGPGLASSLAGGGGNGFARFKSNVDGKATTMFAKLNSERAEEVLLPSGVGGKAIVPLVGL